MRLRAEARLDSVPQSVVVTRLLKVPLWYLRPLGSAQDRNQAAVIRR
jgi:hypothetical protein